MLSSFRATNPLTEAQAILLIGAVQFANILDFMMVMPLGPDFAQALGIPGSHLGYIGGIYTLTAAFSGLVMALILDKLDRHTALVLSLAGLCVATLLGGLAWNFESLLVFRACAGFFGGPVTAVGLAVIADVVPAVRRGTAMGKVMGAFSLASLLGVPFGLELAGLLGWRAPFFTLAGFILVLTLVAYLRMPSMTAHRAGFEHVRQTDVLREMLSNGINWQAFSLLALGMGALFMLIPNIAAYVQYNLGYPRDDMGLLYFVGGVLSLIGMRIVGRMADRVGPSRMITSMTALLVVVIAAAFMREKVGAGEVIVLFALFMLASSARNVCVQTLNSQVPPPSQRASFSSIQAAVTHLAMATGAFAASMMLGESATGQLEGMSQVALIAIVLSLLMPALARLIEQHVRSASQMPHSPKLDIPLS
jgi:predicted MFS family arabinose efflux permease